MITLFHWDIPQTLQEEFGGFNSSEIVNPFVAYADFCFKTFGSKVEHWFTFNEPYVYCVTGHGTGTGAPGLMEPEQGVYQCGHNTLLAHAYAYEK